MTGSKEAAPAEGPAITTSVPVGAPPAPPIPPIPPTPPIPLELDDEPLELLLAVLDALETLPPAPPIPPTFAPPTPPMPPAPPAPADPPVSPELLDELFDEPLVELEVSDPVPPDELPSSLLVAHAQKESKRANDSGREKRMIPLYAFRFDNSSEIGVMWKLNSLLERLQMTGYPDRT